MKTYLVTRNFSGYCEDIIIANNPEDAIAAVKHLDPDLDQVKETSEPFDPYDDAEEIDDNDPRLIRRILKNMRIALSDNQINILVDSGLIHNPGNDNVTVRQAFK